MQRALQDEEEDKLDEVLPILEHPFIARWDEDGCWYRCFSYQCTDDGEVSVIFADFGNTQRSHVSALRYLPLKYMHVPQQTYVITQEVTEAVRTKLNSANHLAVKSVGDNFEIYLANDSKGESWRKM